MIGATLNQFFTDLFKDLSGLNTDFILLAVLFIAGAMVLDAVTMFARREKEQVGVHKTAKMIAIDGGQTLPARSYISDMQGLAGRPDAIIREDGFIVPVECKPLAKKLRDRYVAQLLVYMRLIEEFEGTKPPHGYLILGPACKKFKIDNTPERQAWLQKMLDEMKTVLQGCAATPSPHPRKCAKCGVREQCSFAAESSAPIKISRLR